MIKIAAYQAPLLGGGSMEAIGLIAQQIRACEAAGVEFLCCPEAVLGGLCDYASRPSEIAIRVRMANFSNGWRPWRATARMEQLSTTARDQSIWSSGEPIQQREVD